MAALDPTQRASVVQQAQKIAAQQGITPEQALYNYAQQNGIDPAGVDTYMGFSPGTTQNWAVQNGQLAAPQGNYNPGQAAPAPAPTSVQPLGAAQRASVVQQAQDISAKYGISPEMALWNYANQNGIDPAGIDSYMGFAPGTSSDWAAKNGVGGSPSKNLGMGGLPAALDPTQRASVVQQAQYIAKQQGITPEQALYNYAQKNNISNAGIDAYMGYQPGAADTWLKQNPQGQAGGGNLGMGQQNSQYTPNPYLDKMAQGITSHMYDNWTRNQLPSIRSGAMAAGGFGGSRQGVVEANGLNDMNRSLGQNLANMYGSDYNNSMGRNLQQQSINNSYDLGLRNSDLGFGQLDANINQQNFNNNLAGANFGMGVYGMMNGMNQQGINSGTQMQNTPLDYQKYFTNSANATGGMGGTQTGTQGTTSNGLSQGLGLGLAGGNFLTKYFTAV